MLCDIKAFFSVRDRHRLAVPPEPATRARIIITAPSFIQRQNLELEALFFADNFS